MNFIFSLILAVFFTIEVLGRPNGEPKCSRFDYEEKMLEKTIRMEHANELMFKEVDTFTAHVKQDLKMVKAAMAEVTSDLEKVKTTMEDYGQRISRLGGPEILSSYAFSSYWLSNTRPAKNDGLVFSEILLNEADVYDKETGKFTVPLNGIYTFAAGLCTNSGKYASINFVADGSRLGQFDIGDNTYHKCSSGSTVADLKKGMRVWLKVSRIDSSSTFQNNRVYSFNYFTGHLVGRTG